MKRNGLCIAFALLLVNGFVGAQAPKTSSVKPNIIYILCDDLGIGDVKIYNAQSKINTPNIDRLGNEGMVFKDAHSSSSVCTPSRYSILTGRYAWRSRLSKYVLLGYDKPLIDSNRLTVAGLLKDSGYQTACIGKWHLGLGWHILKPGANPLVDYTKPITNGPTALGFDYFYGIAASLDMPPFIYIENEHTVGLPTVTKKWQREGPAEPGFEAVDCLPNFTSKAVSYIKDRSKEEKPFFLYLALPSPHTPIVPSTRFAGKSGLSDYGDYVMETDWAVGEILNALDTAGIAGNTLVIFTSDNGCSPAANTKKLEALGHFASGPYRGYKADIWEGGHRIPFLMRWPNAIKSKTISEQTVCFTDFMATAAAIVNKPLPANAAEDSYSMLPYLTGKSDKQIRPATVHHSIDGNFAIREGKWKLELCPGSGGWAAPKNAEALKAGDPAVQLYDLSKDPAEKDNLQATYPDVTKRLTALLLKYVDQGRSTPGKAQKNDAEVDIWKTESIKPNGKNQ